jgi:hypothetical protein
VKSSGGELAPTYIQNRDTARANSLTVEPEYARGARTLRKCPASDLRRLTPAATTSCSNTTVPNVSQPEINFGSLWTGSSDERTLRNLSTFIALGAPGLDFFSDLRPGSARSARTATGGTVPLHCSRRFEASNENKTVHVTFGPAWLHGLRPRATGAVPLRHAGAPQLAKFGVRTAYPPGH